MLAHSSAATAAAARTTAPPVSSCRKLRIGAARLRAQAVRPPLGGVRAQGRWNLAGAFLSFFALPALNRVPFHVYRVWRNELGQQFASSAS